MVGSLQLIEDLLDCEAITEELLVALKSEAPMLYSVLREGAHQLDFMRPMLQHLRAKISYIYSFTEHVLAPVESEVERLAYFPNMPQLVARGTYEHDKHKTDICNKKAPRHQTLTPGLFTISCEHGMFKCIVILS